MKTTILVWLLVVAAFSGCLPRTTIRKDPGPRDRGVRFYRPKPYLFVKPMMAENKPVDGFVSLEQVTLPDFSEEYSIHVRTGLGTNETAITLDDGWNLTQLNVKLDSQFDENLKAAAELAKAIPTGGGGDREMKMAVRATNVPMGLYEAVVSEGPDSKKRLYGFRYVGFMPYSTCPIESCGAEQHTCCDDVIYGLVFEDGAMVFCPLSETPEHVHLERQKIENVTEPEQVISPGPDPLPTASDDETGS